MTRQFTYPESHKEMQPIPPSKLTAEEIYRHPKELHHLPLTPSERYPPEVVALVVYGRGR